MQLVQKPTSVKMFTQNPHRLSRMQPIRIFPFSHSPPPTLPVVSTPTPTEHTVIKYETVSPKFVSYKAPMLVDNSEWSFTELQAAIQHDMLSSVKISRSESLLLAIAKDGSEGYVRLPTPDDEGSSGLIQNLMDHNVIVRYKNSPKQDSMLIFLMNMFIPFMTLILIFMIIRRMGGGGAGGGLPGGMFGSGKTVGKFQEIPETGVTFDDVAGNENAKRELMEVVEFLKNPEKFTKFKLRTPNVLLVGPPGVGKTLFAKAVAGEAKVPFFSACGSDFIMMFVGLGSKNVRDLFSEAKKKGKCIIFIDEIDSIARKRGGANSFNGGASEQDQTINQLLAEMDGFDAQSGIVVIGATNRVDVLDPAILRGGRFDRQVTVERPDFTGRIAILKVHTKEKPISDNVNFETLAKSCAGLSGADLANIVNEAAIFAIRKDKQIIEMEDFEHALDKLQMGSEKKSLIISEKQRKLIAVHESGHTISALYAGEFDEIKRVSIIARENGAGGVTMFEPTMERVDFHLYTKEYLKNQLVVALGGRVAEEIIFGDSQITTGASSDLQKVAEIARRMVVDFGFTEKMGNVAWKSSSAFSENGTGYSEKTAHDIDEEIKKLVNEAYERTQAILKNHVEQLNKLTDALIEKEVMSGEQIRGLLGL